jgi:Holliday junction resolvasome RuvABC ATP-dependent DNA helicase subunit
LGKTLFAKEFAKNLKNKDGAKRPFLELNCSTIKNNEQFFEQIFIPLIMNNEITILFDEAHALPKDLTMAFLTIFNTEKTNTKDFTYEDQTFTFDFSKQTFIFATTESDKLFPPLKDRLTTVDFEQYSKDNLAKIIELNCEGINFSKEALSLLSSTVRGNARNAVMRAKEIVLYCESENKNTFEKNDFNILIDLLGILPQGITCTERQILEILSERGSCKLQTLSAVTGLSPTSLRRDHEIYLLRRNFIQIDGERKITHHGRNLINTLS